MVTYAEWKKQSDANPITYNILGSLYNNICNIDYSYVEYMHYIITFRMKINRLKTFITLY